MAMSIPEILTGFGERHVQKQDQLLDVRELMGIETGMLTLVVSPQK